MKKILACFIVLANFGVQAQESNFRTWNTLNINQKINKDFNFQSDIQYRSYEDLDQLQQLLIRGGIGYNLTENNNTVLAGYAYIQNRTPTSTDDYAHSHEHRFNFAHRFRVEERFLENDTQFRFRYQLTATVPLNNAKLIENTWYLKAYDEIFLQAVKDKTFDRNRLGLSFGYVISPTFSLEAGYMLQSQKTSHTDHLMIGLTINNPF